MGKFLMCFNLNDGLDMNYVMTKYQSIKLCGITMMITGIFLIVFQYKPVFPLHYMVAGGILISSALALLTAYKSRTVQIPSKYHELHAVGMAVYGVVIFFYSTNISSFLSITTCFFIYYGITELIFNLLLLQQKLYLSLKVLIARFVIGFFIYIGALLVLIFSNQNQEMELLGYGNMFILCGITTFLFRTVLKNLEANTVMHLAK